MTDATQATAQIPTAHESVQGDLEAIAGSPEDLGGPSFAGWSPKVYPPTREFWHATNAVPTSGHLVGQLGVQIVSNTPQPHVGSLQVFWRRTLTLRPGIHQFTAYEQLGPITLRPHSGSPVPIGSIFLRVSGWNAPSVAALRVHAHDSWQWKELRTAPRYLAGTYTVDLGLSVSSFFTGTQKPYGEVIVHQINDVLRYGPQAGRAGEALVRDAEQLEALRALEVDDLEAALVDA